LKCSPPKLGQERDQQAEEYQPIKDCSHSTTNPTGMRCGAACGIHSPDFHQREIPVGHAPGRNPNGKTDYTENTRRGQQDAYNAQTDDQIASVRLTISVGPRSIILFIRQILTAVWTVSHAVPRWPLAGGAKPQPEICILAGWTGGIAVIWLSFLLAH
jgi:hypothetical protein